MNRRRASRGTYQTCQLLSPPTPFGICNVFSVCPARYQKQSGGSEPFRPSIPNLGNNATPEFKWSVSTGRYISFYFVREFAFSFPHCKNAIKTTYELNSAQHVLHCTALHTVHNKRPEPACASMPSDPRELIVKISSEVAPWPTRTTK